MQIFCWDGLKKKKKDKNYVAKDHSNESLQSKRPVSLKKIRTKCINYFILLVAGEN